MNKMNLHPTETKPYNPEDTWKELIAVRTEIGKLKEKLVKTLDDPMTAINSSAEDPWLTESQRKESRGKRITNAKSEINEQIAEIKSMEDKLGTILYEVHRSDDGELARETDNVYTTLRQMTDRKKEQLSSMDNEILSETLAELAERRG